MSSETKAVANDVDTVAASDGVVDPHSIRVLDPKVVRKLRRKLDFIILPTLSVTYILNSLDRSNLGNAKTAGLAKDTNLVGNQYNHLLTIYYVAFVVCGPAMSVFTKICTGKVSIPCMMLGFGIASACTAAARDFAALAGCRVVVGMFESGFLASVVYYLSTFYTKAEIASRIALFYAGAVIASAFGGLLAFGIFHIKNAALPSWAYLFILEGCLTCLVAIVSYFILPRDISSAWFLTAEEKDVAEWRVSLGAMETRNHKFNWYEASSEFRTIHFYARAAIAVTAGILANSNANFLAIMTVRLGYSVTKTNLYTVAPAKIAAVCLILIAYSSDHFCERALHMSIPMILSCIGYIILGTADIDNHKNIGYMAIFFCTIGAYPVSVIFSAWTLANIPNLNARALTMGVLLAIAGSTGLIASNVFFEKEAPRYITALIVNGSFAGVGMCLTLVYSLYLRRLNKNLDMLETPAILGEEKGAIRQSTNDTFRFQT